MNAGVVPSRQGGTWSLAATVALAAHAGVAALVLGWSRQPEPRLTEPVVLVELPPEAAPAGAAPALAQSAAAAEQPQTEPQAQAAPQLAPPVTPQIEVPPVRAPLPRDAVTVPPRAPEPVQHRQPAPVATPAAALPPAASPAAVARPAPARDASGAGTNSASGSDPKAKRQEADYFALVSAHLNRRKVYPVEARQARQQGVVTIRFTVDREGGVSAASLKRSSGHAILDQATLALLQRVAPLPRMPASMQRDQITLSLPIEYSLRTS